MIQLCSEFSFLHQVPEIGTAGDEDARLVPEGVDDRLPLELAQAAVEGDSGLAVKAIGPDGAIRELGPMIFTIAE